MGHVCSGIVYGVCVFDVGCGDVESLWCVWCWGVCGGIVLYVVRVGCRVYMVCGVCEMYVGECGVYMVGDVCGMCGVVCMRCVRVCGGEVGRYMWVVCVVFMGIVCWMWSVVLVWCTWYVGVCGVRVVCGVVECVWYVRCRGVVCVVCMWCRGCGRCVWVWGVGVGYVWSKCGMWGW